MPKPADLLEVFAEEARVDLDTQVKASEGLGRQRFLYRRRAARSAPPEALTIRWGSKRGKRIKPSNVGPMVKTAYLLERVLAVAVAANAPDPPWWQQLAEKVQDELLGTLAGLIVAAIFGRLAWAQRKTIGR